MHMLQPLMSESSKHKQTVEIKALSSDRRHEAGRVVMRQGDDSPICLRLRLPHVRKHVLSQRLHHRVLQQLCTGGFERLWCGCGWLCHHQIVHIEIQQQQWSFILLNHRQVVEERIVAVYFAVHRSRRKCIITKRTGW